ncbi:MAG TPA: type II toxin-antitoxin system YafQ family toxin [Deltaproteobacteria bacterium]|nr:type II toxin-antitoxin system YafQ family toxin [Deltaproteobacteria bacterium]
MLEIRIEKSFKKDIQRDKKSGNYSAKDFNLLKKIVDNLLNGQPIDKRFKRHILSGNMQSYEIIHVKNDWLLVFKIDRHYLNLVMIGKHPHVYKKF